MASQVEVSKPLSRFRRTTCDICRERKVRCNKEHPACERCKRLNLKCTYSPPRNTADVSQALQQLHERLAQAEAALASSTSNPSTSKQSQPQNQCHYQASASWDTSSSSSSNAMLGLSDASFVYFPCGDEGFHSQDFSGSWEPGTESVTSNGTMSTMPLPGYQHSFPVGNAESMEGIQMPFSAGFQLQSVPKPQQPTPTWSTTSSGFRTPSVASVDGSVGQNIISLLHQRYFEATQAIPAIINRDNFFRLVSETPVRHQVNALSHAVGMAGAALSDDFPHLETLCYHSARHYVEQAERQEDGACFQNLEVVQALLLIVRYEFTEAKSATRAWMTLGRVMRLVKLLCLDAIDADKSRKGQDCLHILLEPSNSLTEMDERRKTFWVGFNVDFFISALTNTSPSLQTSEIFTYVPSANAEEPPADVFLKDIISGSKSNTGSIFSPLVIATGLGNKALEHLKLSSERGKRGCGSEYDFWTHHFEIDKAILENLALSPFSQQGPAVCEDALLATAYLTLLAVVIPIHMKACERALQTGFPDSLAAESRQRCEAAATEITQAFQQGGAFARVNLRVCNHIGMYLTWPVSLAAKVQLLRIKDAAGGADANTSSVEHNSIYTSLRVLDSALRMLRVATCHFDDLFEQIRQALESQGRIEIGRQKSLSVSTLNGFIF